MVRNRAISYGSPYQRISQRKSSNRRPMWRFPLSFSLVPPCIVVFALHCKKTFTALHSEIGKQRETSAYGGSASQEASLALRAGGRYGRAVVYVTRHRGEQADVAGRGRALRRPPFFARKRRESTVQLYESERERERERERENRAPTVG